MNQRSLAAQYRAVADRSRPTVAAALGKCVRQHRERKGLTQLQLAALAKIRNDQLSQVELGKNVLVEFYQIVAKALGFRDALDMFTAGTDPYQRKLLRLWPLLEESARKDVLQRAKDSIEADGG